MGMGIAPVGMNMPQQTQGQGKGGGGRSAFNQRLMQLPGFADSLQASQQRMAQDPNANMMRTQPALQPALPAGYDPNVHQRGFGVMVQPSQTPSEIPAGMQGDQLRAQQPLASPTSYGPVPDSMRQMPVGGFGQPDQASMQAQIDDFARRRADPWNMQMQMQADAIRGRRQAPPNMNPVQQQMNDMVRQQQMMRQQMMPQQQFGFNQFPMGNPMFGGLGALRAMPSSGGFFSRGKGGGFSQPQMGGSFAPAMFQGLGGFFR